MERTPWPMIGSNLISDPGQYPAHASSTNSGTPPRLLRLRLERLEVRIICPAFQLNVHQKAVAILARVEVLTVLEELEPVE